MHVEWKIVTGNPQVASKLNEFASVLHMQHQPEACASDLGDDQSCYLLIRLIDCLIDWLIDCMLWLQRLILSRSSSIKEWLIYLFISLINYWLIYWLIYWFIDWLHVVVAAFDPQQIFKCKGTFDWFIDWFIDWLIACSVWLQRLILSRSSSI